MTRIVACLLTLMYLLYGCAPSDHSDNVGDYYLCYKNGAVLSENDSLSQVYIRLHGDGTYIIKDAVGIERGRWKTIDYDFYVTYFYSNYLNSFFRVNELGKTMIQSPTTDPNTKVFSTNWYGDGKLSDDSFGQVLFCQQNKILSKEDLNKILIMNYGSNLRRLSTNR